MMERLDSRERAILKMALSFAHANIDDVVEAFADSTEEDPGNKSGKCAVDGMAFDPPTDEDVNRLSKKLGLGPIAS